MYLVLKSKNHLGKNSSLKKSEDTEETNNSLKNITLGVGQGGFSKDWVIQQFEHGKLNNMEETGDSGEFDKDINMEFSESDGKEVLNPLIFFSQESNISLSNTSQTTLNGGTPPTISSPLSQTPSSANSNKRVSNDIDIDKDNNLKKHKVNEKLSQPQKVNIPSKEKYPKLYSESNHGPFKVFIQKNKTNLPEEEKKTSFSYQGC